MVVLERVRPGSGDQLLGRLEQVLLQLQLQLLLDLSLLLLLLGCGAFLGSPRATAAGPPFVVRAERGRGSGTWSSVRGAGANWHVTVNEPRTIYKKKS